MNTKPVPKFLKVLQRSSYNNGVRTDTEDTRSTVVLSHLRNPGSFLRGHSHRTPKVEDPILSRVFLLLPSLHRQWAASVDDHTDCGRDPGLCCR